MRRTSWLRKSVNLAYGGVIQVVFIYFVWNLIGVREEFPQSVFKYFLAAFVPGMFLGLFWLNKVRRQLKLWKETKLLEALIGDGVLQGMFLAILSGLLALPELDSVVNMGPLAMLGFVAFHVLDVWVIGIFGYFLAD